MNENSYIAVVIKMFFLLTPFFALSMFLTLTETLSVPAKRRFAVRTSFAVLTACLVIYWFGEYLFTVLGITVDAFRVGAGLILMLTAIELVAGKPKNGQTVNPEDASIVPMAIPCIVGPGTIGALLVMGAGAPANERFFACLGIMTAVLIIGIFLYVADWIEHILKTKGIQILSKITGLMLAALAAQIIFTGIKNLIR